MTTQLFVVGVAVTADDYDNVTWQLEGVFNDEQLAVENCSTEYHFIIPCTLNNIIPDPSTGLYEGCYYPLRDINIQH